MKTNILKRAIITERTIAKSKQGFYTFAVDYNVRKNDVKQAVKDLYNIDVKEVKIIKKLGKTRKVGKKYKEVKSSNWKKAIIKIDPKQKIAIFDMGK